MRGDGVKVTLGSRLKKARHIRFTNYTATPQTRNDSREGTVPHRGSFVVKISKKYKLALSIAFLSCLAVGLPLWLVLRAEAAIVFLTLGAMAAVILPTLLTYRCEVGRATLCESYYVLIVRIERKISWRRVRYRRKKIGNTTSLILYDESARRLISFDDSMDGFDLVDRAARRSWILPYRMRQR
jgi:hypothetical protein